MDLKRERGREERLLLCERPLSLFLSPLTEQCFKVDHCVESQSHVVSVKHFQREKGKKMEGRAEGKVTRTRIYKASSAF